MDARLERFLSMMPRGDTLSVLRAADILEGEHRAPELLHLVAIGDLLSCTHSSTGGSKTRYHIRGQEENALPRITPKTDPKSVIVFSEDIVWRWCVEYEGWLQGVDLPPKDTVLAREAAVKLLARRATAPATASDARPDPERRLALLRELGGSPKYSRCEWTFTGIRALVDTEKANGRKRSTEKTIRADLKEAAQNERDAKNAGFTTGLGQR